MNKFGKLAFALLTLHIILFSGGCLNEDKGFDYTLLRVSQDRVSIEDLEPNLRLAVLRGEEIMKDKSLGENKLSCESCHPNPELNSDWAVLFPRRWASTRNPKHRVITLAQHNYGAYKDMMEGSLQPDDPSFNYLNAYLMWLGEGKIIWAVETPGQFQVEKSIESGKKIFQEERGGKSCESCHEGERLTGAASNFPRYIEGYDEVLILDNFLVLHVYETMNLELDLTGSEIADLSSYLTNLSKGYVISLERAD